MVLDLSFGSDMESARDAGGDYADALVSPSLGSMSLSLSPRETRQTMRAKDMNETSPRRRARKGGAQAATARSPPSPPTPSLSSSSASSSIDGMIAKFRASASSMTFSTTHTTTGDAMPMSSPVLPSSRYANGNTRARVPQKPATRDADSKRSQTADSYGGMDDIGMSPMPKLTNAPKPKPSLLMAPKKSTAASSNNAAARSFTRPQQQQLHAKKPAPAASKLQSPKKVVRGTSSKAGDAARLQSPRAIAARRPLAPPSPSSSHSNETTASSILEDIDAPDDDDDDNNDDDTGQETSIDHLIGRDLHELNRLVSSSHHPLREASASRNGYRSRSSPTAEEITREFQQSTRFRSERTPDSRATSFRLFDRRRDDETTRSVHLKPVHSVLHRSHEQSDDSNNHHSDEEEDSFVEELTYLRSSMQKDKEAAARAKVKAEAGKKKNEEPGANLSSLRAAAEKIDETLLLALRPFARMKEEMDKEDAKQAAAEEKALVPTELPMATQAIVEHLEQAFGSMTRQREAECKAETDAAAAAKADEDAKKKAEAKEKAKADREAKERELEILKLIPLRGKLMTTPGDVEEALLRLECAEALAQQAIHARGTDVSAVQVLERQLVALQEDTRRRVSQIDAFVDESESIPLGRGIDWRRERFHIDHDGHNDEPAEEADTVEEDSSFSEVIKYGVLEKLDFTILKLKHALAVDQKEAQEAEVARCKEQESKEREEQQKRAEDQKQQQLEQDAAAARQRVMGIASLHDLAWISEADARLQEELCQPSAVKRLEDQLDIKAGLTHDRAIPSFFDADRAMERFDSIRHMMNVPNRTTLDNICWTNHQDSPNQLSPTHSTRMRTFADRVEHRPHTWSQDHDSIRQGHLLSRHHWERNNQYDAVGRDEVAPSPRFRNVGTSRSPVPSHRRKESPLRRMDYEDNQRVTLPHLAPRSSSSSPSPPRTSYWSGDEARTKTFRTRLPRYDKIRDMMHSIQALQANRREKADWFQSRSTLSYRHR